MKNNILFMIFGMVLMAGIGIGVYAINASEITYNNTTVEGALDTLYTTQNTIVASLTNANNALTQENSTLSSQNSTLSNQVQTLSSEKTSLEAQLNQANEINAKYIDNYVVYMRADVGGEGYFKLDTSNYSNLKIDSMTYSQVVGTTYFKVLGSTKSCSSSDYNDFTQQFFQTTGTSTITNVDVSNYNCVMLYVQCVQTSSNNYWASYAFNNIRLYNN